MISNNALIWVGKVGVVATVSGGLLAASVASAVLTTIFMKTISFPENPSTFDLARGGAGFGVAFGFAVSGVTSFCCAWDNHMFSVTDNNTQDVERFVEKQLKYTIALIAMFVLVMSIESGGRGIKSALDTGSRLHLHLPQTL